MGFYLHGKTIPGGVAFVEAPPHSTIEAALAAAKIKMSAGAAIVWVVDHESKIVLTADEVRQRIDAQNSN